MMSPWMPLGVPADAYTSTQQFMEARIRRQDELAFELLTDTLRAYYMSAVGSRVPVTQVSNPCWYRYEIVTAVGSPAISHISVRVYQHFWAGDAAGGPPRSWGQDLVLIKVADQWRVDYLSPPQLEREEPAEPRAGTQRSACNVS